MGWQILPWAISAAITIGPSTNQAISSPMTAPSIDPVAAYQSAVALIHDGKIMQAQTLLLQADRSYQQLTKPTDPQEVQIVYALGVCDMLQNQYLNAHRTFERIRPNKTNDRSFILNDAKSDLATHDLVAVGVKELDTYLKTTARPDEQAIDLLGAGIDKAIQSGVSASGLSWATEDYTKFNTDLEHTRPKMHHWGQEWLNGKQYSKIEGQKKNAERAIVAAKDKLSAAEDDLVRAQGFYNEDANRIASDSSRRPLNKKGDYSSTVNPNAPPSRPNAFDASVTNAKRAVEDRKADLQKAESQMPKPAWALDLRPIVPAEWNAPSASSSAPAAASVPTVQELLKQMIQEIAPGKGKWSAHDNDLARQWFADHVKGKPVAFTAKCEKHSTGTNGSTTIVLTSQRRSVGALTISFFEFTAELSPTDAANVIKLVAGHSVEVSGVVQEITLTESTKHPGQQQLRMTVSQAAIQSSKP